MVKKNNWGFPADFSPHRYKVDKRSPFPTKNPKINQFVVKSLLESNCKRFRKSAIREKFNQILKRSWKKLIPITDATKAINTKSKRESVTSFLHLCLNHIWAPGQWHVCIPKSLRLFIAFASEKHISRTRRATNEPLHYRLQYHLSKHNY